MISFVYFTRKIAYLSVMHFLKRPNPVTHKYIIYLRTTMPMHTRIQTEFNSNAQNGTNRSHALLTCKSSNCDKASTEQRAFEADAAVVACYSSTIWQIALSSMRGQTPWGRVCTQALHFLKGLPEFWVAYNCIRFKHTHTQQKNPDIHFISVAILVNRCGRASVSSGFITGKCQKDE